MVDLILLFAIAGAFYGGFWCGKTFNSFGVMWQAIKDLLKGKL